MKQITLFIIFLLVVTSMKAQMPPCYNLTNYGVGSGPVYEITADFNGDGKADIATANRFANTISILLNSGTGTFATAVDYTVGSFPVSLASADFNADGKLDLVVANSGSSFFSVLLGLGNGTFSGATNIFCSNSSKYIAAADFNSDGKMDVVLSFNGALSMFPGLGNGNFSFSSFISAPNSNDVLLIKDLNADSKMDIITVNSNSNNISVLMNSGFNFAPAVNYNVGTMPTDITSADYNSDGNLDLAVINSASTNFSVLNGSGTGTFASAINYGTGNRGIASGDFNGDGKIDLVTMLNNQVYMQYNLGTGTFSNGPFMSNFTIGSNPFMIIPDLFNLDTKTDLAFIDPSTNMTYILNSCIVTPGEALNFVGFSNDIDIPFSSNIPVGNSNYTIEAKIKPNSSPYQNIASWGSYGSTNQVNAFSIDGAGNLINMWWGNDLSVPTSPINLSDGYWHHVAVTYDGTTRSIYVDGILKGQDVPAAGSHNVPNASSFRIGSNGSSPYFNGSMDEFRIWNIARKQCDINSYKDCEIPTTAAGLVINYHFNQGIDSQNNSTITSVTDASGNGNNGSIYSFMRSGPTSNFIAPGGVVTGYTTTTNTTPTVSSTVTNSIICMGNSTILNGTGASTYTWTGGVTDGVSFSPTTTITYTVTGTAITGCTNTAVNTVTVNSLPAITVNSGTVCNGQSFVMIPSGASTYTYSSGSAVVTPTTNTSYSVTGTNAQGCVSSNTAIASVTLIALPSVTANVTNSVICNSSSTTLTGAGASTYTWTNGVVNGVAFSPTVTNTYTVIGTSAVGCTNTATKTVTVNTCTPGAALSFDGVNDIVSMGTTSAANNLCPAGFSMEAWIFPRSSSSAHSIIRKTGDYNLFLNNGNLFAEIWPLGTSSTTWKQFSGTAPLTMNVWSHVAFTWDGTTGLLYVNGNVIASGTLNSTVGGSETLHLGASAIFGNPLLGSLDEVRIWNTVRTKCQINTFKDCEIATTAAGLVANYHFNQGFAGLSNAGSTSLTDASGNSYTGTLSNFALTGATSNWIAPGGVVSGSVTPLAAPTVSSTITNSVICNGSSTTLNGTGATTYTWTGGVTNNVAFSPSATTAYTVTGTLAATGCTNTSVNTVTVMPNNTIALTSAAGTNSQTKCFNSVITNITYTTTGATAVTVTGLPTGVTGSWTTNTLTISGSASVSGTFVYTVTLTGGCGSVSTTGTLTITALPTVMATVTNSIICNGQTTTLTGSGASTYTWTGGATNGVAFAPSTTTIYTVTGTSLAGCTSTNVATSTVGVMSSTINTSLQRPSGSGYAIRFDGIDDVINMGSSYLLNNVALAPFSMDAWIFPTSTSGVTSIIRKDGDFDLYLNGGVLSAEAWTGGGNFTRAAGTSVPVNQWSHVAAVWNGSAFTLYINGTICASAVGTSNNGLVSNLNIGGSTNFGQYFVGTIDEVCIWRIDLTQTEVRDWMCKKIKATHPKICKLVAYYRFDESSGNTLFDYTNGQNGTLANGPVRVLSGAPLGDNATWLASATVSSTLSLAHPSGDNLKATLTAGNANLMVVYSVDTIPNVTTPPGTFNQLSQIDYFGVKLFGSTGGVYSVLYDYTGHVGIANETSLGLASRANNSTISWTEETSAVLNTTTNTLLLGGQTGTEFILASRGGNSLPIELLFFNAELNNLNTVDLTWATASEINSSYYVVERSSDGFTWESFNKKTAAGTTTSKHNYSDIDEKPYAGISYYRLKQVDFDGTFTYSQIESVNVNANDVMKVSPNPFSQYCKLEFKTANATRQLEIYNSYGQLVLDISVSTEQTKVELDFSKLAEGIYYLKLDGLKINQKLINYNR